MPANHETLVQQQVAQGNAVEPAAELTTRKEEDTMKEAVIAHARKMRAATDSTKTKCVDGGYKEDEAVGAIAIPGGHLGVSMALLELGFSPEDAFGLVYDFTLSLQEKSESAETYPYCWHSDKHEGHHGVVVGCGHCNAAIKQGAEHYGVDGAKVQELLNLVRAAQESGENMELVVLDREHTEQAILVVTSADYTVKPWDQTDDVQFFIYDKTRHMVLLKELVAFLAQQGRSVDLAALVAASEHQTNSTLGLLGSSKGKPIYTVDVSQEEPVVEHVGQAPVVA